MLSLLGKPAIAIAIWASFALAVFQVWNGDWMETAIVAGILLVLFGILVLRRLERGETIRWPSDSKGRLDVLFTFTTLEVAALLCFWADVAIFGPVIAFFGPVALWETARYRAQKQQRTQT